MRRRAKLAIATEKVRLEARYQAAVQRELVRNNVAAGDVLKAVAVVVRDRNLAFGVSEDETDRIVAEILAKVPDGDAFAFSEAAKPAPASIEDQTDEAEEEEGPVMGPLPGYGLDDMDTQHDLAQAPVIQRAGADTQHDLAQAPVIQRAGAEPSSTAEVDSDDVRGRLRKRKPKPPRQIKQNEHGGRHGRRRVQELGRYSRLPRPYSIIVSPANRYVTAAVSFWLRIRRTPSFL